MTLIPLPNVCLSRRLPLTREGPPMDVIHLVTGEKRLAPLTPFANCIHKAQGIHNHSLTQRCLANSVYVPLIGGPSTLWILCHCGLLHPSCIWKGLSPNGP